MKTPAKSAFLLLLTFLFSSIYGQNEKGHLSEELTLLLDNEVKMVIESNEILKIPIDKEQDTIFRNLLADVNKVQDSLSRLSSLNDIEFTELVQQAQSDISVRKIPGRKAKTCSYKIENDTIDIANADIRKRGLSVISPGANFGISYIYDRFLASVSASVGYVFAPKTETRKTLGISCECFANIDPNEAYNVQYNYFVDVFYGFKLPHNAFYFLSDTKVFIGYLLHCEGDVFQENTFRWGLEMPAGKNFRIVCTGYHTNLKEGNEGLFEIGIKYKLF